MQENTICTARTIFAHGSLNEQATCPRRQRLNRETLKIALKEQSPKSYFPHETLKLVICEYKGIIQL
jgi:hypothetical protein